MTEKPPTASQTAARRRSWAILRLAGTVGTLRALREPLRAFDIVAGADYRLTEAARLIEDVLRDLRDPDRARLRAELWAAYGAWATQRRPRGLFLPDVTPSRYMPGLKLWFEGGDPDNPWWMEAAPLPSGGPGAPDHASTADFSDLVDRIIKLYDDRKRLASFAASLKQPEYL